MALDTERSSAARYGVTRDDRARRVVTLFNRIRDLGLDTVPAVAKRMAWLQRTPNDDLVLESLERRVAKEQDILRLHPDPLRRTTPRIPGVFRGSIPVGTIPQYGEGYSISPDTFEQLLVVAGKHGGGKTTTIKQSIVGLIENHPNNHFIALERKPDEFTDVAALYPDNVTIIDLQHLRMNLLRPPDRVSHQAWLTLFVELLTENSDILTASSGYIYDSAMQLIEYSGVLKDPTAPHPDIHDLYRYIESKKHPPASTMAKYRDTCLNRIKFIRNVLGPVVRCSRGLDVTQILDNNLVILLQPLPYLPIQNLLIEDILGLVYIYRSVVTGTGAEEMHLTILDESLSLFRRADELRNRPSFVSFLITQLRSLRIGVIAAFQYLTDVSHAVLANAATKIVVGGLERVSDVDVLVSSRPTSPDQRSTILEHHDRGYAFIADMRHPHLIQCNITKPDLPPKMSRDEIAKRSAAAAERFGWDLAEVDRGLYIPGWTPPPKSVGAQPPPKEVATVKDRPLPPPATDLDTVLRSIAKSEYMTARARAKEAELPLATITDAISELIARSLVVRYKVQGPKGGAPRDVFEITEKGYERLGVPKPRVGGKATSFLHRWVQNRIAHHFERQGYNADIEGRAGDKAVDIIASHPQTGEVIGVEVELNTDQSEQFLVNLTKDFASDRVRRVLCLVSSKATIKRIRTRIGQCSELVPHLASIEVDLIANYLEE